ncbi:sugar ABC transporter permease [Alicyclobacillus sp. TC]|uniref:sugar ABC transporter permease n=1 Tax=Alicyclobacillus sp. TC TaxID=2606450 RepID=UPI001EE4343E|nr:sugar ABC transporter permease [Alicyclobacillus sp. TC]
MSMTSAPVVVKEEQAEPTLKLRARKMRPGERLGLWASRLVLWIVIILVLLPIWFVFTASINPINNVTSFQLIPPHATFANYQQLLFHSSFFVWVKNTVLAGVTIAIIQVFITAFAAYAFARMRFWGRKYGLMVLILLQMFPNLLVVIAYYSALSKLNMMDTLYSYILVMIGGSAFNVWLLKGYFDTVPVELDEAAIMDGANSWQRFVRILLPLALPMLVVIFLFTLVGIFSDYAISSAILISPSNYTLAVGMYGMISNHFGQAWGEFAAAALLSAIPLGIIFGLCQRWIASGLVAGSVKG